MDGIHVCFEGEIRRWVIEGGSGGYGFQKNVEMP